VAVHGGLFLDENASCPLGVLGGAIRGRAAPDEEGLEEAVRAEADVRDEPARKPQPLHRLRHLLRRRVPARGIVLGGCSRCRRRRRRDSDCRRLSLLHLALLGSIRLTLGPTPTSSRAAGLCCLFHSRLLAQ
jgi:hypothetical protein